MKIPRIITCTWVLLMTMMFAPNLSAQTFEYPEYQGDEYEPFPVNIQGKQPTITDFANTFLNLKKEEKFFNNVYKDWNNYLKKKPLSKNVSISKVSVDQSSANSFERDFLHNNAFLVCLGFSFPIFFSLSGDFIVSQFG